jgi:hypothetical protein
LLHRIALLAALVATAGGCGGPARALIVKSDPADAELCIKGSAGGSHFAVRKSCVGTTPFDADRVEVADDEGHKHVVKFKDVERSGEKFYVIVSRPGYAPRAVEVPGWEHMIVLSRTPENP